MKIAAVSDDGIHISQHFGRALYYAVITVDGGMITDRETRSKAGHHTFAGHEQAEAVPGGPHGYDAGAQARHSSMAASIVDCQVVLAGGMGWGAYESLKTRNIEPIVTDVKNVYQAVELYLKGKLPNLVERLH